MHPWEDWIVLGFQFRFYQKILILLLFAAVIVWSQIPPSEKEKTNYEFYLQGNSVMLIIAVHIPPDTKAALSILYSSINDQQTLHPDGVFIAAGDFNQADMKKVSPHFSQHAGFGTRGANLLDHVYTNIKGAYIAVRHPHLGSCDLITVMLLPAYRPLLTRSMPSSKQVRVWPEGALSALQDGFDCTD